jgi:hypothetical protein
MLNSNKTLRTKQPLLLARETVRSLLSPAFAANDPKNPPQDPQRKDKHPPHQQTTPTVDDISCPKICPQ